MLLMNCSTTGTILKNKDKIMEHVAGHGSTCLQSQDSESWGRRTSMSSRPAWTTYTVRPFKKTNHGNCEVCCANKSTIISKGSSKVIEKMKKQSVDAGSASLLSPIQLNAYSEKVKVCLKTWKNKVIRMHLLPIAYSVRLMNESDLWMCPRTELVYK